MGRKSKARVTEESIEEEDEEMEHINGSSYSTEKSLYEIGDSNQVSTLDEALSIVGFGKVLCLLYGVLGWVSEAMEMTILSFIESSPI